MIMEKTVTILHFEDNHMTQRLVSDRMKKEFPVKMYQESTLINSKMYLKSRLLDVIDVIICDYMFPKMSAGKILNELANSHKTIIFYSCLDEEEFCEECIKIIGTIPYNFKYVGKEAPNNLRTICEIIKNEVA